MTTNAAAAFTAAPAAPAAPAPAAGAPAPGPAAPAHGGPAAGTPPAAPAPATQWFDTFQNADVKTWVGAKGFKDPAAVAESAYNLEKLIGFEKAGRTILVPKDDASPEEVKAFRAKMGVPETADGYKIESLKDSTPEFQKTASEWMHKAGIPPAQADALAKEFVAYSKQQQQTVQAQLTADSDKAFAEVNTRWGKDADRNMELGRRFANAVLPAEVTMDNGAKMPRADFLKSLFDRTGATAVVLEMFAKAGGALGEHPMAASNAPGGGGVMSPQAANARIQALRNDPAWVKAYVAGDKDKLAEMTKLHTIAAGVPG